MKVKFRVIHLEGLAGLSWAGLEELCVLHHSDTKCWYEFTIASIVERRRNVNSYLFLNKQKSKSVKLMLLFLQIVSLQRIWRHSRKTHLRELSTKQDHTISKIQTGSKCGEPLYLSWIVIREWNNHFASIYFPALIKVWLSLQFFKLKFE